MQDDNVLRLRELAKPGTSLEDVGGVSVFADAADEIQRLRERESLWLLCAARTADVYGGCFRPQPDLAADRLGSGVVPPGASGGSPVLAEKLAGLTRWIPVSERLPEEEQDVLVFTHEGTHVAALDEDGIWCPSHGDGWEFPNVTHWMPLPEPPEVN